MSKNKTRTKDKYRVVYNDTQRIELENEFRSSEYISIPRKHEIAQKLQLSERQIKIWFQNRRAKKRKQQKRRSAAGAPTETSASLDQEHSTRPLPVSMSHHQQHSYHQVIQNSCPDQAIVAPTGAHQLQHQQLYTHPTVVASPSLEATVIGASSSAASSPVATRPDAGFSQQPVTPSNNNHNNNNNYYQPATYQEPANSIYQCQQDYYNHRPIEPFQQQTHQPPPNTTHGWTSNASPADQTTSAQVVGNVNHHHLHICQGLMEQVSGSSTSYSTGVSNINQQQQQQQHPISVNTSYTNGYSHQQHYQQPDNVHLIQQHNNSNHHHAIIQPPLQHNQKDIYASSYHILSTIN